jgi:hypothetical protein
MVRVAVRPPLHPPGNDPANTPGKAGSLVDLAGPLLVRRWPRAPVPWTRNVGRGRQLAEPDLCWSGVFGRIYTRGVHLKVRLSITSSRPLSTPRHHRVRLGRGGPSTTASSSSWPTTATRTCTSRFDQRLAVHCAGGLRPSTWAFDQQLAVRCAGGLRLNTWAS